MLVKRTLLCFGLVVIISTLIITTGCAVITGSGDVVTREFNYDDFNRIEVGYAFTAEISQSDSYLIKISMDDNLFEYLEIGKSGDTLQITMEGGNIYSTTQLRAVITLPDLEQLELSGASEGYIYGFHSSHDLDIEISGASQLEISDIASRNAYLELSGASKMEGTFNVDDIVLDVSGASTVILSGSGEDISLDVSGASTVDLSDLILNNAWVNLSGASKATINASGQLNGDLSGASLLEYLGNPTIGSFTTSGASSIRSK